MITNEYKLSVTPQFKQPVVWVSQYDTGARVLKFNLYANGAPLTIPSGTTAVINGVKADGTVFSYSMTVGDTYVQIEAQEQMTTVAGAVTAEIVLTGTDGDLGTANFTMMVERSPLDEGVISESEIGVIQEAVDDAQQTLQQAQTVLDSIPADYSELSDDVDDLKSATQTNPPVMPYEINYEMISFSSTGELQTNTDGSKWGTPDYIDLRNVAENDFSWAEGYTMWICLYNKDKVFKGRTPWGYTTSHPKPDTRYYPYARWFWVNATYTTIDMTGDIARSLLPLHEILPFAKTVYNNLDAIGLTKWAGKKWVCVGDSLTEENATALKKYHALIAEQTGITVLNYGKSGTGYGKTEGSNENFCDRVTQLSSVDCDVITIFGSFNDMSLDLGTADDTGTSTLGGYINTTLDNLYTAKPFVSVGIILPTPWWGRTPQGGTANSEKAISYCNMILEICRRRSIPVLDLFHNSNLHPNEENFRNQFYYQADGVHPNSAGHAKIAPMIKAFLETII